MAKKKDYGESYYYLDGKFLDRMDGSPETRRRVANKYRAKVVKIKNIRHSITGKGLEIRLSSLKKAGRG
ncbi:hypothetical protein LCGC14_0412000 [marine sediment metagenome]|uniref:Uncharacterized protein n=1 Tax=marine sediment metagenome TaxID=412755 RepID=A0A0F9W2V6_9ZZZZ